MTQTVTKYVLIISLNIILAKSLYVVKMSMAKLISELKNVTCFQNQVQYVRVL